MTNDQIMGTVAIGTHSVELPEEEARSLFLLAGHTARKGGPIAVSKDTTVFVSQHTNIAITIRDGFSEEYNPQRELEFVLERSRQATRVI